MPDPERRTGPWRGRACRGSARTCSWARSRGPVEAEALCRPGAPLRSRGNCSEPRAQARPRSTWNTGSHAPLLAARAAAGAGPRLMVNGLLSGEQRNSTRGTRPSAAPRPSCTAFDSQQTGDRRSRKRASSVTHWMRAPERPTGLGQVRVTVDPSAPVAGLYLGLSHRPRSGPERPKKHPTTGE